ncbi:MAG: plasma-membrane proton-efflux P-type ATPase [Ktedonobacterales bacterium]
MRQTGGGSSTPRDAAPLPDEVDRVEAQPMAEGLTEREAVSRLAQYGHNELVERGLSPVKQLLSYFWGPIPWMIEAAGVFALILRAWGSLLVIVANLVLNAAVAFWEEYRASRAITALKQQLAPMAYARREGVWRSVPARDIVPGDVIRVRLGNIVPADARVLPGGSVELDRSMLTGESLPVSCQDGDVLHSGTVVRRGEADALVFATGQHVAFAETVRLVEKAHPPSHLQQLVLRASNVLIVTAILLDVLVLATGLRRGDDLGATIEFTLLLTVAAIPASMPTVLSVILAVGAGSLASKKVLISRLASIEELAGMDVLCSDKTGTLTQNQLAAGEPYCLPGMSPDAVLLDAALASRSHEQDAIDSAVLRALPETHELERYEVVHFQPFDPMTKRTEAEVRESGSAAFRVTKGAVQVVLALADPDPDAKRQVEQAAEEFAAHGYRSLAVARTDVHGRWHVEGVLPLQDPLCPDAAATIEQTRKLGAQVKLLTGDHISIATEIARRVGLTGAIHDASQLGEGDASVSDAIAGVIDEADGFAEVVPRHKYQIVEALQRRGHIVGMTGDGVNDAPAMRKSDVGIAVTGATDVARSAADLVLMTSGLAVLTDAITESRAVFHRMSTYVIYRIAETIQRLLSLSTSLLVFVFYPVTPIVLALLATANGAVLVALAYDTPQPATKPVKWRMASVVSLSIVLGILGLVELFGLFYLADQRFHLPHGQMQTLMYLGLSLTGFLTIIVTRTRGWLWSNRPSTILLGAMVVVQSIATLIAVYGFLMVPLGWAWALGMTIYCLVWMVIKDAVKVGVYGLSEHYTTYATRRRARVQDGMRA